MSSSRPSPPGRDSSHLSPPPSASSQLRQRPNIRTTATTSTEPMKSPPALNERRSSVFSDMSDARKVLRDSTDDLFLPRPDKSSKFVTDHETSNWQSVPLGLALLPAVAGLLIKEAGAVVTDLTLLALAAVFLNWSVRVPWDWYRSAQATRQADTLTQPPPLFDSIIEEHSDDEEQDENAIASSQELPQPSDNPEAKDSTSKGHPTAAEDAQKELQAHELLALISCFLCPMAGAWLLHAIRSQLSRPSEGLVSNYNLTVFLLAAEVRPASHLIKMIQGRTLYLQRVANTNSTNQPSDSTFTPSTDLIDLTKRLEDLETHVADSALKAEKQQATNTDPSPSTNPTDPLPASTTDQITTTVRTSLQSDLDALNRAVRKYEKRTTLTTLQTEQRLQDLESRLQDALVLAAAAQRSVAKRPDDNFLLVLLNWVSAAIVLPMQVGWEMATVPMRAVSWGFSFTRSPYAAKREREREGMRRRVRGGGAGYQGVGVGVGVGPGRGLKEKRATM